MIAGHLIHANIADLGKPGRHSMQKYCELATKVIGLSFMRILFVEDSERLRRSVSDGLRKSGFAVDTAPDGEEGLHLAKSEAYDVVVLDIMLPKLDGLSLLQRLREEGKDTHVLLLTARDTVHDRVVGLRAGADDYLVKPFAFEELVARVETLARRQNHNKQSRIHVGDLEIDTSAKSVSRNG